MKKLRLTKAELSTMQVLWDSSDPLSISDIPTQNPKLNPNTVAVAIKNLQKKGLIKVADIAYHKTALTRRFCPIISKEQYFISVLNLENVSMFNVVSTFIKNECNKEELEKLEEIIREKREINK